MPKIQHPTRHEVSRMEPAMIFQGLLEEAATWEDGFQVRIPDPEFQSFVPELREKHYPEMTNFEIDGDLEIVVAEIDGDENQIVYDVVRGTVTI